MAQIRDLERRISKIEERNIKVEADKAWETSWTRKFLIFIFTYIIIAVFFHVAGFQKPFINSIVPAVAFVLSTLTFPLVKKLWLDFIYKR